MSSYSRSDSTIVDETNLSPRIEFPEPTAPINSYDREDDDSEKTENGLAAAVQEVIMDAIEELIEKLPAKVREFSKRHTKVTDYLHLKRGYHKSDDDDDAVDEIMNNTRGVDVDGDHLKNERFKVRIVDIGGSVPVKQLQDNKNGNK